MRLFLVFLVFLLDVWALHRVTGLPSRRQRVRWIALIVFVPVIGVALWARNGAGRA